MTFSEFFLAPELQRAITEAGFTVPTPIQEQAMPLVLTGHDVMGAAQTGTGKTAAFVLPLLHLLLPFMSSSPSPARHPVRALILTPTRELAMQVEADVRKFARFIPLRSALIYGGVDMKKQEKELQAGVDMVVATPGRLLDHVKQKNIQLKQCQSLVLDEADRMLDMGFLPDIEEIVALLGAPRQTLLFSATFAPAIKDLAKRYLKEPKLVEVSTPNAAAQTITQLVYDVNDSRKYQALKQLVRTPERLPAIVFTNTKVVASRINRMLQEDGFSSGVIHGDRSQLEREQTLADFKADKLSILVATDVAARGLDIAGLPCVINYDLPFSAEDYVHRIGRTGRAGLAGCALSLFEKTDTPYLQEIEALLKTTLPRQRLGGERRGSDKEAIPAPANWVDQPYRQGDVPSVGEVSTGVQTVKSVVKPVEKPVEKKSQLAFLLGGRPPSALPL